MKWISSLSGRKKLGVLALISLAFAAGCSQIHGGVYSYEEVYVANKANDFEFSHFKFFGSDHVLILNQTDNPERTYSGLCKIHNMNCQHITLNVVSEKAVGQVQKAWAQIQKFNGDSFLLISDDPNSTAAVVSKYAKAKYNESPQKLQQIFKALKVDQPEAVTQALSL